MIRNCISGQRFSPSLSCAATRILRGAFVPNARSAVIVTLSRLARHSRVSMHSLLFSQMARAVSRFRGVDGGSVDGSSGALTASFVSSDGGSVADSEQMDVNVNANGNIAERFDLSDVPHADGDAGGEHLEDALQYWTAGSQ